MGALTVTEVPGATPFGNATRPMPHVELFSGFCEPRRIAPHPPALGVQGSSPVLVIVKVATYESPATMLVGTTAVTVACRSRSGGGGGLIGSMGGKIGKSERDAAPGCDG